MEKILLIDDDRELGELLRSYLGAEGFALTIVTDGESGLEEALRDEHELVILDVMLPGLNGFEVLRRLRAVARVPVLMLTARGEDVDRIIGLELGADDYLAKPFNPRELTARIRAILRRVQLHSTASATRTAVIVGDLALDPATRTVRQGEDLIELTSVEFDLLEALLRQAGRIVSREDLTTQVLGRSHQPLDRSIDMHISNLRKKLGARSGDVERIKSIRGAGYIYTAV